MGRAISIGCGQALKAVTLLFGVDRIGSECGADQFGEGDALRPRALAP